MSFSEPLSLALHLHSAHSVTPDTLRGPLYLHMVSASYCFTLRYCLKSAVCRSDLSPVCHSNPHTTFQNIRSV
jgi:hypothetical protein